MTFKKVHKRADTLNQRRQLGPVLTGTPTTTTTTAAPTTTTPFAHNPIDATGPPLLLTTTTHTSSVVSTSSTSSVSSVSTSASTSRTTSASTVPTTPPVNTSTRTMAPVNSVTRSTVHVTASSTTSAATPTSTSDSGGMGIGSMAGIAAAAIIGIGVITAFVVWFIRRRNKNHDIDEEPFNRNSFLRHSTAIPDDDAPLPSRTRPPPSMAERQPTPVYGGAQMYNDMGQNAFGYNTQPSYSAQPGQTFNHPYGPGGAPATPLPYSPGFGTAYDQQQGFNNGGYADLTRGPPNHEYPPSPHGYENPHSPQYVGHDNFPMPPATAAGSGSHGDNVHYPELTPATTSAQQGQVVSVRDSVYNGRETPVQLGFAPASGAPAQPHQGRAPNQHGARPETVYDTDDAYGGI